jgi:hypothetical protein
MAWIGTFLMLALAAGGAGAPPPEQIEVCALKLEAQGTLAAGEEPRMDEAVARIRRVIPKRWNYAAYRHLGEQCFKLAVGKEVAFSLPAPYRLLVRREAGQEKARLSYRFLKDKEAIMEAGARLGNNGVTWVGGPSTKKGTLFVLLSARW